MNYFESLAQVVNDEPLQERDAAMIGLLLHGAPEEASDFVGQWVKMAERAKLRALHFPPEKRQDYCEHESVRLSLENLMTFPCVREPVASGTCLETVSNWASEIRLPISAE